MSVAQNDTPNVKVLFKITDDEGEVEETLWAADLGKHYYRLANLPFYAYGVSLDDVVYAPREAQDQFPTFQRIISKSGRKTLRVILNEAPSSGSNSEKLIKALNCLGCGIEGATPTYIAVDVPSDTNLAQVVNEIERASVKWEYADPIFE
jgi:hypothetical protein